MIYYVLFFTFINPLNVELNPIRHLLALVGARHIVHVSRVRVNQNGSRCTSVSRVTSLQAGRKRVLEFDSRYKHT